MFVYKRDIYLWSLTHQRRKVYRGGLSAEYQTGYSEVGWIINGMRLFQRNRFGFDPATGRSEIFKEEGGFRVDHWKFSRIQYDRRKRFRMIHPKKWNDIIAVQSYRTFFCASHNLIMLRWTNYIRINVTYSISKLPPNTWKNLYTIHFIWFLIIRLEMLFWNFFSYIFLMLMWKKIYWRIFRI